MLGHLQLFQSKTSILSRLMPKYISLVISQPASQPATDRMCRSIEQSRLTSTLVNINTKHKYLYPQGTTNMPCLLPLKLSKVTVPGQMVNMTAPLLMLVKKTVGAPTLHTKMNVSLFLLEHTKLIGNSLLVC